MKQVWDHEFIDSMIEEIERLEEENRLLKTGFGKYVAGHRPGEETWSSYDQQALELACGYENPVGENQ
jgi:hypothetical protein